MLKTSLFVLLGLLVLAIAFVLLLAARQPDTFRVQRTAAIAAPPERIYPLINDLRQMNVWNPFMKKDPAVKTQYRGPAAGAGAGFDFHGNKDVGKGSIQILEASAPSRVTMKLDMIEPMEGHNTIVFDLVPQGHETRVTWSMHGPYPLLNRVVGVVLNMDKMIGGMFETGLTDLKTQAEKRT